MPEKLPRGYLCRMAPTPPAMDGDLERGAWANAPWTQPFRDIEGDLKPDPPLLTRAKMLWDRRALYIGAWLQEPNVWGTLTEHDCVIFQDNDFELFIDPDGDHHNYFELEFNALNTLWDLRLPKPYRDGGPALNEWEAEGIRHAVHVRGTLNDPTDTDEGWTLEVAIPWSAFAEHAGCPCPPRAGDLWRMNFSRVEWDVEVRDGKTVKLPGRPEHNWIWSPQGVVDMHRPERWGHVRFAEAAAPLASFRPDPSQPDRDLLMQVYHAQKAYHAANKRWAADLVELGERLPAEVRAQVALAITPEGWRATRRGAAPRWALHQDSRFVPARP